jgi:hypothetical protein
MLIMKGSDIQGLTSAESNSADAHFIWGAACLGVATLALFLVVSTLLDTIESLRSERNRKAEIFGEQEEIPLRRHPDRSEMSHHLSRRGPDEAWVSSNFRRT